MEKNIETAVFLKILKQKNRSIVYTNHALAQAIQRGFITNDQTIIPEFENDIKEEPSVVVEQGSESRDEKKFKIYYESKQLGEFMCYVIKVDGQITLITLYRTSKKLQKSIYKYRKQGYMYEKHKLRP